MIVEVEMEKLDGKRGFCIHWSFIGNRFAFLDENVLFAKLCIFLFPGSVTVHNFPAFPFVNKCLHENKKSLANFMNFIPIGGVLSKDNFILH